jgi:glyoxylase-like metal-dependent hydrolase (beta-lactamase superfamily II)
MKPFEQWTVLAHGRLTEVDEGLLTVTGDLHMPIGDFPRRMTVVRLDDGRLVIYSAISLHEDEMQQLERYGVPSVLVVPNEIHRMDAKIWKERYPAIIVAAPRGARDKISEVVHVDIDVAKLDLGDLRVRVLPMPGTDDGDTAIVVERPGGTTIVLNDVIWNLPPRKGVKGFMWKVFGFTSDVPKTPRFVAKKKIKDPNAFRSQLERWANIRNLRRIIVSHGDIVDHDVSDALRHVAAKVAA